MLPDMASGHMWKHAPCESLEKTAQTAWRRCLPGGSGHRVQQTALGFHLLLESPHHLGSTQHCTRHHTKRRRPGEDNEKHPLQN